MEALMGGGQEKELGLGGRSSGGQLNEAITGACRLARRMGAAAGARSQASGGGTAAADR
jgi:hypothetical protein